MSYQQYGKEQYAKGKESLTMADVRPSETSMMGYIQEAKEKVEKMLDLLNSCEANEYQRLNSLKKEDIKADYSKENYSRENYPKDNYREERYERTYQSKSPTIYETDDFLLQCKILRKRIDELLEEYNRILRNRITFKPEPNYRSYESYVVFDNNK